MAGADRTAQSRQQRKARSDSCAVEVASLIGDIAVSPEGKPALHLHIVVGKADGHAMAGHLGKARVRPTLEVIVTESPAHLRKRFDAASGLALVDPQLIEHTG
jgi:uncharacterized protein